jgi:hypothetical protein
MTTPDPATGRFSVWSVILIGCAVGTAGATTGWTVGRSLLGDEIDQYRTSDNWKVPRAIEQLGALAERLNLTLDERNRFESLQANFATATAENEKNRAELAVVQSALKKAQERLGAIEGETLIVPDGDSVVVVPRELTIGVLRLNQYAHDCTIQLGDKRIEAVPGTVINEKTTSGVVRLTLRSVSANACTFSVIR